MTGYRGDPALYVLCEGFAYEGIQSLIAIYPTEEAAEEAKTAHADAETDSATWFTVLRVADRTSPFLNPASKVTRIRFVNPRP